MKIREFVMDCPLGLGWATNNITTGEAVAALAKELGVSVDRVREMYQIDDVDLP